MSRKYTAAPPRIEVGHPSIAAACLPSLAVEVLDLVKRYPRRR